MLPLLITAALFWSVIDPEQMVILPADQVGEVLHQCSRRVPPAGTGYWRPSPALIAEMESKVHEAVVTGRHPDQRPSATFPHRYARQYVGYWRQGHRFVYGNYAPLFDNDHRDYWRKKAMIICDGGPAVFGAEYDVEKAEVSHIAFNGMA